MRLVLCLLILLLGCAPVWATTTTVIGTFTEPSTNANQSPLTDLAHTNMYIDIHGDGLQAFKSPNHPASSPTGGAEVSITFTAELPPNTINNYDVWVTATDSNNNESGRSNVINAPYDTTGTTSPPSPPVNLQITDSQGVSP